CCWVRPRRPPFDRMVCGRDSLQLLVGVKPSCGGVAREGGQRLQGAVDADVLAGVHAGEVLALSQPQVKARGFTDHCRLLIPSRTAAGPPPPTPRPRRPRPSRRAAAPAAPPRRSPRESPSSGTTPALGPGSGRRAGTAPP